MPSVLSRHLPILGQVWRLAFPVILTSLLQSLVNVVDVFMVGRLGPVEVAAVGMSTAIRMLVFVGILSVTAGSMALAAQAKGANDPHRLSFVARQSISLTVLLALLLSVIGWFIAEPALEFLNSNGDPRAVIVGTEYLKLLFLGTVFLVLNFAINSLMQGAGDTVTPLVITSAINLMNIVFNFLFIFGPGPLPAFGVTGAALGTVLARFLSCVAGLLILYSGKNVVSILPGSYRPDWQMFKDILSIGVPSGLQGIVRNSAQLLVLRIVTSTAAGTFGATALAIGLQIESLAFMPGIAISIAATSLVGQSLGAWQVRDARLRGNTALLLGIVIMSAIGLPIFIFAPQLIILFEPSAHPVVVEAGSSYLRINALSQPILAFAMILNGALRGAGDTRPGLIGTILGRWFIAVPLAYGLAIVLDVGVAGVWWALLVGTSVQALYVFLRWRSERWSSVALRKTALYRTHLSKLPRSVQSRYLQEIRSPLLGLSNSVESVSGQEVSYDTTLGGITVEFSSRSYAVTAGAEIVPEAQRSASSRARPRYS